MSERHLDPPEDDDVTDPDFDQQANRYDPMDDGDYAYDNWKDRQAEDRDCDYWNRVT